MSSQVIAGRKVLNARLPSPQMQNVDAAEWEKNKNEKTKRIEKENQRLTVRLISARLCFPSTIGVLFVAVVCFFFCMSALVGRGNMFWMGALCSHPTLMVGANLKLYLFTFVLMAFAEQNIFIATSWTERAPDEIHTATRILRRHHRRHRRSFKVYGNQTIYRVCECG